VKLSERKPGEKMRLLSILSGIAVLLTTAAFAHMLIHLYRHAGQDERNLVFMTGMAVGIVVGIFSLVGAFLLFRRGR
jgi:F0F1-type ATP synthase assembly protein I